MLKKSNGNQDNLKTIITFDAISDPNTSDVASGHLLTKGANAGELRSMAQDLGVRLVHFNELITAGENNSSSSEENLPTKDTVITLCYTSGTTGNPKGAMLTHANLAALLSGILKQEVNLGP